MLSRSNMLLSRRSGFSPCTKFVSKHTRQLSSIPSLEGKNFISIDQLSNEELNKLLDRAAEYKRIYKTEKQLTFKPLAGENVAMIFQKRSTRTRISSELGMNKLGGHALFLSSDDIQLGVNETMRDTANVLSRFNSLILARVNSHKDILDLAKYSSVPVINALCDKHHPLQALADYLTLKEHFGSIEGKTISWVGDGNNVAHDLMLAAPKLGMNVNVATPKGYEAFSDVISKTMDLAKENNTKAMFTTDPIEAVNGSHVIATDTWISMGQEEESSKRLKDFNGYKVTMEMAKHAAPNWKFLHCLPRHEYEVDDEVFYSDKSIVFDEAENRMWTVMAVMSALLGK